MSAVSETKMAMNWSNACIGQHMRPQIERMIYHEVELKDGSTEIVPADVIGIYQDPVFPERVESISEPINGWIGRMAAPGYLDCTDWITGESYRKLLVELYRIYGDDDIA